ncbi:hypothetical protein Tco_0974895 [Tanacetum coccineum]|uniref:Reverse transcriptase domain-containing protein n=1 Tax=Tanacetum coccineum TaxID=301880 RepID=A0ABQ5ECW6_9ASTR
MVPQIKFEPPGLSLLVQKPPANTSTDPGSGTLPGNTITNPKEDLKGITTRSGVTIQGPKAVNHDVETRNPNPEPNVAPIPKASIPFPSRRNDEKRKEKANDQNEKPMKNSLGI